VFREIPTTRAISEIDNRSDRRNRRISAQSSTLNTRFLPGPQPRLSRKLVNFQLPRTDHYSVAVDNWFLNGGKTPADWNAARWRRRSLAEIRQRRFVLGHRSFRGITVDNQGVAKVGDHPWTPINMRVPQFTRRPNKFTTLFALSAGFAGAFGSGSVLSAQPSSLGIRIGDLPLFRRLSVKWIYVSAGQTPADGPGWTRWSTCSEQFGPILAL
jgi:hypothetical protein